MIIVLKPREESCTMVALWRATVAFVLGISYMSPAHHSQQINSTIFLNLTDVALLNSRKGYMVCVRGDLGNALKVKVSMNQKQYP